MVDEITDASPSRQPPLTLAADNPAPEAPPDADAEEHCGCFATRGRSAFGFKVRTGDRYYSCQYAALLRTGERSGWDAELSKEVLTVAFTWGALLVTGKGLEVIDALLAEHRVTRLSLGDGTHGVRIDDVQVREERTARKR